MSSDRDSSTVIRPVVTPVDTASLADALNRSSSLNAGFPTRTLRITMVEQQSRDNTPTPLSIEDLTRRPRSNPRSRTPMRYESPLESDAFRLSSPTFASEDSRRINIRPMAGAAVGTVARRITAQEGNARGCVVTGKSSKQGPSQRKVRRWRNEHFTGLAAEISASSSRGAIAADVLLKAHRDAHLYRSIYDPNDHSRSDKVNRYVRNVGQGQVVIHIY
jgi:hypothetical protein